MDTVRACKVLLRNLDKLDGEITSGQYAELERLLDRLMERIQTFLEADAYDEGLWIGEE